MTIGNKIVELRKKYNFTQERLAEKIGISRQTLSSWESNSTSPDLAQATQLAQVLKFSLDELADNNTEIACKDKSKIFNYLIDKTCYLTLADDFFDFNINSSTPIKVLSVKEDFIKVECLKQKKDTVKLIDMDLIVAIKVLEGERT